MHFKDKTFKKKLNRLLKKIENRKLEILKYWGSWYIPYDHELNNLYLQADITITSNYDKDLRYLLRQI